MHLPPPFPPLAALNDQGVFLHDIFGGLCLLALLVFGFFLRLRQRRWVDTGSRVSQLEPVPGLRYASVTHPARIDRRLLWVLAWSLYGLVFASLMVVFFVLPRATSQRAQVTPEQRASGLRFDGHN